ncbi:ferritin-like domain-containing protein [Mucilaginibacter agri]|uniref:Ferritin-like domain-containing protein n=1 Tax=Mucilaginibacter agri TaxID=2695265 RepID=A0A966DRX2_9SPHI|nr:ferritin-like domain-containing protein [Mucilaginibacter agri]NCD68950.1 ferritin-like domain-containing protein [Mucilaginibacter agri]
MKTLGQESPLQQGMARRQFLRYAGTGAAMAAGVLTIASCSKDHSATVTNDHVDLGSGDIAILNYAYALEQLEAAFYIQVAASPYANQSTYEKSLFTDIRDHEVAHREFFKAALGTAAIEGLTPNFSTINFSDRTSVLAAAKAFEDLGVSAYNGAGYMIQKVDYLALAGKIVSVEARHAALIRNLISPGSFADSTAVDANGLDGAKSPKDVVPIANTFLSGKKILAPALGIY